MIRTPALMFASLVLASAMAAHAEESAVATAPSAQAHANFAHPAVAVARMTVRNSINPNTFIVQPPASTTWTVLPESKTVAVVATAQAK